jgi:hypothetical protein
MSKIGLYYSHAVFPTIGCDSTAQKIYFVRAIEPLKTYTSKDKHDDKQSYDDDDVIYR